MKKYTLLSLTILSLSLYIHCMEVDSKKKEGSKDTQHTEIQKKQLLKEINETRNIISNPSSSKSEVHSAQNRIYRLNQELSRI